MPADWSDAELDLLSAYIDEQLDDSERTALEARLAQDADLRQELAAMRQTVALLRGLPTIRAPRAFTLTPEMVGQQALPVLTVLPAAAVPEKRQRPTRRIWWIPAASAAGVVLLAGIFAVTQLNAPMAAPASGGSVAMERQATATQVQDPSTLNTVIELRSTTTPTAMPSATAAPTTAPLLARTDAKIEPSQDQSQASAAPEEQTAEDDESAVPAPPVQPQVFATPQPTQSRNTQPIPEPVEAATNAEFAPRMSASPTSAIDSNMQQESAIVLATPTGGSLDMSSGGGVVTAPSYQTGDTVPANSPAPEMVTGMNSVNTNPDAPGFSVSTVAPVQATIIAQYHAPTDQTVDAASTMNETLPTATVGVFAAGESTARPPIWIRWFNTLSDWLAMLLGQR